MTVLNWKRSNKKDWSSAPGINFNSWTEKPTYVKTLLTRPSTCGSTYLPKKGHTTWGRVQARCQHTSLLQSNTYPDCHGGTIPPNFMVYLGRTDKHSPRKYQAATLVASREDVPDRRFMHILDYELLLMIHEDITD